jgi:acid phosphatase family membrane protein YuiD
MDFAYLVTPLLTWLVVGPIKFLINSARQRRWAFNLVGNGGFPSNHSSVVTSMATLIALREGIDHPAFGVAVTLAFIVMIDANSLRQHVGRQAAAINRLATGASGQGGHSALRERMGHTLVEICGGIVTGIGMGFIVFNVFGG